MSARSFGPAHSQKHETCLQRNDRSRVDGCRRCAAFPCPRALWGSVCWDPHKESVRATHPLVSIVDDDESVCQSLPDLLRELGFSAQAFSSAEAFLASDHITRTECLLLDVAMPGMSGPDLQRQLRLHRLEIPIIFITAQTDETLRQRLLEQGAVACLLKPFNEAGLLEALKSALQAS